MSESMMRAARIAARLDKQFFRDGMREDSPESELVSMIEIDTFNHREAPNDVQNLLVWILTSAQSSSISDVVKRVMLGMFTRKPCGELYTDDQDTRFYNCFLSLRVRTLKEIDRYFGMWPKGYWTDPL